MVMPLAFILAVLAATSQINALNKCDAKIIENIKKTYKNSECPKNILHQNSKRSPLTWILNPEASDIRDPRFMCKEMTIKKEQSGYGVTTFWHYKNGGKNSENVVMSEVEECGHIVEKAPGVPVVGDIDFHYYVLDNKHVFCFYSCTNSPRYSGSYHYGACLVPTRYQNNDDVKTACSKCKESLIAIGVNDVQLKTIKPCPLNLKKS